MPYSVRVQVPSSAPNLKSVKSFICKGFTDFIFIRIFILVVVWSLTPQKQAIITQKAGLLSFSDRAPAFIFCFAMLCVLLPNLAHLPRPRLPLPGPPQRYAHRYSWLLIPGYAQGTPTRFSRQRRFQSISSRSNAGIGERQESVDLYCHKIASTRNTECWGASVLRSSW